MFRRLTPILAVIISVLLDTAVIPMLYHGAYLVPLSLIIIMAISVQLGRIRGVLYGLIAGIMLDISCGTPGIRIFGYIGIGFMMGFLLDRQAMEASGNENSRHTGGLPLRIFCTFVFAALYELAILFYQYFSNAVFEWIFVRNLLIRVLITTALSTVLFPLLQRIFIGTGRHAHAYQNSREGTRF